MNFALFNINDLSKEDVELVKEKLPVRYAKSKQYLSLDDQRRCIAAGLLMLLNIHSFKETDIKYTDLHKPYIEEKECFNLSHSGDYVLFVSDKLEIGCDIQKIDNKDIKYSSKLLTPNELDFYNQNPQTNFHILWTQKEAVSKLIGKGLTMDLSKIDVSAFENNKPITIEGLTIYCETRLLDDYVYSVAYQKRGI